MVGLNKYDQKERREQRRRNHIKRDLKYHQRIVPSERKRKWLNTEDEVYFDWEDSNDQ